MTRQIIIFYHLVQSTWWKLQELGLINQYCSEEDVKPFCGMLDDLAFISTSNVSAGLNYLWEYTPECLELLIN